MGLGRLIGRFRHSILKKEPNANLLILQKEQKAKLLFFQENQMQHLDSLEGIKFNILALKREPNSTP